MNFKRVISALPIRELSCAAALLSCLVLLAAPVGPAEAGIKFRGAGTESKVTLGGNVTPGLPTGWQVNDIHIAIIQNADDTSVSMDGGWTQIDQGRHDCCADKFNAALFWRRAQSGDTAPTVTYIGTESAVSRIIGFSGVVPTGDPFDVDNSWTLSAEDMSVEAAGITTSTANTMLVFVAFIADDASTLGAPGAPAPGTWTEAFWSEVNGNGVIDTRIQAWYRLQSGTGSQPLVQATWTLATKTSRGAQIALKADPTIPGFEQSAYRLFRNADSTTVGTALAAQDTAASSVIEAAFRLKMLLRVTGPNLGINGQAFKLQFAARSGTCDTAFTGETYADVTTSSLIAYNNNATPADGDPVENVADLTYGGDTIVGQTYEEVNNFTNPTAINANQDGKWDFALKANGAAVGAIYCFRVVLSDGSLLDTYTVIPQVTIVRGTIFYFHDATTPNAGTLPAATTLSATSPNVLAADAGTNRDMNQTIGSAQASAALTTLPITTLQKNWFRRFISRPLAAQTLPTGVWTIQGGASEANSASNMFVWGAVIKVWRPGTGVVATLLDDPTLGVSPEPGLTQTNKTSTTGSIAGVAVARGDMLVVELWAENSQGNATARINTIYYDGTTEGSTTSNAAYLLAPGEVSFTVCAAEPAEAGYVAVNAQSTQATVYWSSSDPVLILQRQGGSGNITGQPTDGATYTNETIGDAQVIYSGAAASSYQKTGLANGNTYYYKVFTKTGSGATSCYALAGTTTVNALHPASAPPAWSYMLGGGSAPNAGITGTGTIYTSTGAGRIVSLNTADGTQSWAPAATTNAAAIQGWLTWLPATVGGSSGLKLIQTGEVTMDATPKTVGITQVDPSKSFVICSNRVGTTAGSNPNNRATCELSSTALTITTSLAEATNIVRYYVVEFKGGVSVQRGTAVFGTSDTTPNPAVPALTAVDLSKSFVLISERMSSTSTTIDEQWTVQARLTTATNLELTRNESGTATTVAWQVIQMDGASVQRGTLCIGSTSQCPGSADISTNGSERQNTATLLTGVDTSKSFIVISRKGGTLVDGWESKYQVRAKFSSTGTSVTGLTFIRGHQEATANHQVDIAFEVVSLSDGSTVQGGDALSAAGGLTLNAPISAIDTSRTVPFFSASVEYTTQTNNLDETSWTGKFDTTTNLLLQRGNTGLISRVAWFVVQFPQSSGSAAVIGGDQGSGSPSLARVYSADPATGNPNWTTVLRTVTFPVWGVNSDADVAQATVAAQVKAWSTNFGSVPDDLIFVATANTGSSLVCGTMNTNNKVFALKGASGVPQWVFNLSCTDSVDVFYGMPYVDYGRNRLYVASRAGSGGGQRSFWALDTTTGSAVACAGTDCNLGHLETSPTLRYDGTRVYVGDTSGNLYAMDATATPLAKKWTDPVGFKINGFVWEDYSEAGRLYFSTVDGKVRCRKDTGLAPGACANWTADSTVAGASTPLLLDKLFVGSTDGNVYQIDPATGGTPERSFAVPGGGTVGTPSTEDGTQIFVGTSGGKIFRINLVNEGGVWKLPP